MHSRIPDDLITLMRNKSADCIENNMPEWLTTDSHIISECFSTKVFVTITATVRF